MTEYERTRVVELDALDGSTAHLQSYTATHSTLVIRVVTGRGEKYDVVCYPLVSITAKPAWGDCRLRLSVASTGRGELVTLVDSQNGVEILSRNLDVVVVST